MLKHEQSHDSALARFLLRRALMHPREIGQQLYWHLRSQADSTATKLRYSIVLGQVRPQLVAERCAADLAQYLRSCGSSRHDLGRQVLLRSRLHVRT